MKNLNQFSKNIIGIVVIGIIKFITDAVICPALGSAIVTTVINLLYIGVDCFVAAIILSENGCVFPRYEKTQKLLVRNSVVRMIIAFIISAVLTSSIVTRIVSICFNDYISMSVALGVLYALSWIIIYITMTAKNSSSPRIGGLFTVCATALVFSVISQYISAVRIHTLMQNMNGSLLGYLSAVSGSDYISLIISCVADILIMCSMTIAAHFFRRKSSV